MASVWVNSVHNLHCPECDARLVQRAGRFRLPQRPEPVYVGEVGTLACRGGHRLPTRADLYAYRDRRGHAPRAPVTEASPPRPVSSSAGRCPRTGRSGR